MKRNIGYLLIAISLALLAREAAQAGDQLAAAGQAFNRGDYSQAIRLLEEARTSSKDCEIPFYIGLSQYRLRQLDHAIVELASAASCNPQSIRFHTALAEAYAEKGDDNRSLAAFEYILQLDPQSIAALRSASILYLRHDMSDKALPVLEKLVALDKTDARAAADLASTYAAHNQYPEAERFFAKALSLEPRNVSALVGLGNLEFKSDRFRQAVDVLSRAIRLDPQAYEPVVLRARACTHLARYSEALTDFQTAIQLGSRNPELYFYLSQAYRSMGREDDSHRALAEFTRLRDESNRKIEMQRDAARMVADARRLLDAGNLPDALAILEKARDLDHGNAPVLFRLAGLYFENGQYHKAETSIQDAIGLAPAQWDYHYLHGLIERGVGQHGPARQSFEKAVHLNPSAAEVHNQLGELAMLRSDFKAAVQEFTRAVQLSANETSYRSNLERSKLLVLAQSAKKPIGSQR